MSAWQPADDRYERMEYRRCGRSGLKLPALSLGLWHNFGGDTPHDTKRALCRRAFDLGITHFDLANNYGPPPGSAEQALGEILKTDLAGFRDELVISSKAGYGMWPGPYGEWGSRKYLVSSCDQSLKRLGLDYVDIFYSHRYDPDTPLEETMMALDHIVRSGRALYAGISSYNSQRTREAVAILKQLGTPCLIHQPSYSMINRWIEEDGLLDTLDELGIGSIVFSPLAQGMLSDKYLDGIPADSRAAQGKSLRTAFLTDKNVGNIRALNEIAKRRGQTLAQMAIAWVLRGGRVTSALVGASRPKQLDDSVGALANGEFSEAELAEIEPHAREADINLWAASSERKGTGAPMIVNPILPGFNPDPSICRAGDDYYIATSTFEWYPGVQIHHSRDLANWTLVKRPLERASQLDMRGNPDSCGIWAPCLSYADGLFWLVYTDVKRYDGNFKDAHNYIVTAPAIEGPWSDPVYANSSGFDPSLFHDEDGRKWFLNMVWNHRTESIGGSPKHPAFDGILLQEFDPEAGRLTGPIRNIFAGSPHGLVEGPHLHKRDGWYYLTTAEGGTGYDHAVTMARSRTIEGPYELHPDTHLITSKDAPEAVLQRAGHGQIVETPDGAVYHTHLCSRPLPGTRRSPLGRETAIQKCVWRDDGWLYLEQGGQVPAVEVEALGGAAAPDAPEPVHRDFDGTELPPEFQWLRTPEPEKLFALTGTALRLYGRESIGSWFEQALVARRQEHFSFRAETEVAFDPRTYQQAAGITHYYNRHKCHFLAVTWHETLGRVLTVMSCPGDWPDGRLQYPLEQPVEIRGDGPVGLAADVDGAVLRFAYRVGDGGWQPIGPELDASVISDEGGRGEHGSFTGAFVGMLCFDTSGARLPADFGRFSYAPRVA